MAESELGVLSSQCLDQRIPDKQTLIEEVAAWERSRNQKDTPKPIGSSPPMTLGSSLTRFSQLDPGFGNFAAAWSR